MQQYKSLRIYLLLFSVLFLTFNNLALSILTFVTINILLVFLSFVTMASKRRRAFSVIAYLLLTAIQIVYVVLVRTPDPISIFQNLVVMLFLYLLIFFSFVLQNYLQIKSYQSYYFFGAKDASALPFGSFSDFKRMLSERREFLGKTVSVLTRENVEHMIGELLRNNSFSYTNNGTLTEHYFSELDASMSDAAVYIVLSDTGSVPSQVIGIMTDKSFNHVSISFDRDLKTLISYNGGERVNPPGLNSELIGFLAKKPDAAIYVYKLNVTLEQKRMMADKIREINQNGSAYNMLGLFLKRSYKPNIMYCSQFVYTLLKHADATYFSKNPNDIRPTDLVELDYRRVLEFEYEIRFQVDF